MVALTLSVGTPRAGVIGGERQAEGLDAICVEVEGLGREGWPAAGILDGAEAPDGVGGCLVAERPVLQDLADLDTFAPETLAPRDFRESYADMPVLPDRRAGLGGADPWQGGEGLVGVLSQYVTVVPGEGEPGGGPDADAVGRKEGSGFSDLDLFGLEGSFLSEMLSRSLLRELLVDVLVPAIGNNDERTFSVLGFGQFRLEYHRASSSLQLIETRSDVTLALTSGRAGSGGGGVNLRFGGSGSPGGGSSPLSSEEMALHIAMQLLTSVWFYVCLVLGVGVVGYAKFRRLVSA
jgi:hypothetical protein